MLYQLAKTSVGLTGQVKWNLILNNNKVSDFQLTPIHESVNFNYAKRDDTLNYTHIQNLNRLYKKIPYSFFQTVVRPELNTGYPVRNTGARIDTHENSYEMGMKRVSYKRWGKQFAFFCPVWCDNKEEIKNIVFKIVVKNDKDTVLSTRIIDHSLIKNYISQFVDEFDLNQDLIYLDFKNYKSWTKGINVQDGRVQIQNSLNIIDNIKSQERTILETDGDILNQFSNNNMVCGQLFNFNFIFDINDIILPQLMNDFLGEVINIYVDVYYNNQQVPIKDIYSNYDFIPKYDIYKEGYSNINCLDYLKDYACLDSITKNKLVQTVFHWSLTENPDYMLNFYNGCCPSYQGVDSSGLNFNGVDFSSNVWDPRKNQLGWCKPHSIPSGLTEYDVVTKMTSLFSDPSDDHWYHAYKQQDTETFWINNILYQNSIKWNGNWNSQGTPVLTYKSPNIYDISPSLYDDMYFNVSFIDDNLCHISDLDHALASAGFEKLEEFMETYDNEVPVTYENLKNGFVKCLIDPNGTLEIDNMVYILLGKSKELPYFNMISFMVPLNTSSYLDSNTKNLNIFIKNLIIRHQNIIYNSDNQETPDLCGALLKVLSQSVINKEGSYIMVKDEYNVHSSNLYPSTKRITPVIVDNTYTYSKISWQNQNINARIIYNLRSLMRTLSETLSKIVDTNTIIFEKSISGSDATKPPVKGEYSSNALSEIDYYNINKFSYVFRYDGKIQPYFIDIENKDEHIYNNTYIVKQYNQQINVLECSDSDMILFNDYVSTKFSPLYPSLDYFALRKKKCNYNQYHRGSRRYLGEKSWFKVNQLYVLPHAIRITYKGKSLDEDKIKDLFKAEIDKIIRYKIKKNPTKEKKDIIFEHFIYPLYEHSYQFDYLNSKTIDQYIYTIKYTLK